MAHTSYLKSFIFVMLFFSITGCIITDIPQIFLDRQINRIQPLQDGELKRLRMMSYWDFSWVHNANFSADGKYVYASFDNEIDIWDVTSGKKIKKINLADKVCSFAFSPDMKILACSYSGPNPMVRLLDFETSKEILSLGGIDKEIYNISFSPNAEFIAAMNLHKVYVWECKNGNLICTFSNSPDGCDGPFSSLIFSHDKKYINTIEDFRQFRTWSVQTCAMDKPIISLSKKKRESYNESVAICSTDGSRWVTGDQQYINVWDGNSGLLIRSWKPYKAVNGWSMAISPDGKMAAHTSQFISVWNVDTGEEIWRRQMSDCVGSINFSPDNKFIVTGAEDGSVRIWAAPVLH